MIMQTQKQKKVQQPAIIYLQELKENDLKVCKQSRNAHVKIYHAYRICVQVTYCTNKSFLNYIWFAYLYFFILI